jgi:small GTP-binding protein
MNVEKGLINAIVYTEVDDFLGPNPIYWSPSSLPENIRMLVGIKTVTILTGDQGITPESLFIIPFPSLRLKGLIRYIEREDKTRRGGYARSAITFLFKEEDDIIFYKYLVYLKAPFNEVERKIIELEKQQVDSEKIFEEIKLLGDSISKILEDYRSKEISPHSSEEFPEHRDKKIDEVKFKFKLAVLGDPGVGKTSIILRFSDNAFLETYIPTMGVNITEKSFRVKNDVLEVILWDIAGQAKFQTMRKHFYQGSEAIILIFDLTNPISFKSIKNWYADVIKNMDKQPKIIGYIFGNKSDLVNERKVQEGEGLALAKELNLEYIETSALTGRNVEYAFYKIAEAIIETHLEEI